MDLYLADKKGLDVVKVKKIKNGIYILDKNKSGKDILLESELYSYIRDTEDRTNVYIFGQEVHKVVDMWNDYVSVIKNFINSLNDLPEKLNRERKIIDTVLCIFSVLFLIGTIFITIK